MPIRILDGSAVALCMRHSVEALRQRQAEVPSTGSAGSRELTAAAAAALEECSGTDVVAASPVEDASPEYSRSRAVSLGTWVNVAPVETLIETPLQPPREAARKKDSEGGNRPAGAQRLGARKPLNPRSLEPESLSSSWPSG